MPDKNENTENNTENICGVIMPISSIDGCSEQHWKDVKAIISEAIKQAGFMPELVSDADDVGIIQSRIINNLYTNPIVVCDVSCKNPNVMFELGMRLAFDKPTIIIKDEMTAYSFDTSPIEHLGYRRDLRYSTIVEFKKQLAEKIKGTIQKSKDDPNYTTFLKHFGTFKIAKLDSKEISKEDYILEELQLIKNMMKRNMRQIDKNINYYDSLKINDSTHYKQRLVTDLYNEIMKDNGDNSNLSIDEIKKSIHAKLITRYGINITNKEVDILLKNVLEYKSFKISI